MHQEKHKAVFSSYIAWWSWLNTGWTGEQLRFVPEGTFAEPKKILISLHFWFSVVLNLEHWFSDQNL